MAGDTQNRQARNSSADSSKMGFPTAVVCEPRGTLCLFLEGAELLCWCSGGWLSYERFRDHCNLQIRKVLCAAVHHCDLKHLPGLQTLSMTYLLCGSSAV